MHQFFLFIIFYFYLNNFYFINHRIYKFLIKYFLNINVLFLYIISKNYIIILKLK